MKNSSIIVLFSAAVMILSCSNSADSATKSYQDTKVDPASTGSSSNYGTITCAIDGNTKTFNVRQGFFEINLDPYSKGPKDGVEILDGEAKREGFQFEVKKSGTSRINGTNVGTIINYYNAKGVVYTGKDVVVNVTSYNGSKLSGTFSGELVNVSFDGGSADAKNYPEFIKITDGKFDVSR